MTIQHVVAFSFPSSTPSIIEEVRTRFFALADECVNEAGAKVIASIRGGKQDNWEGASKGLTVSGSGLCGIWVYRRRDEDEQRPSGRVHGPGGEGDASSPSDIVR